MPDKAPGLTTGGGIRDPEAWRREQRRRMVKPRPGSGRFRVPGLPLPVDPAVLEAKAREGKLLRARRGRAATILTSQAGITSPIPLGGLTLLGSGGG